MEWCLRSSSTAMVKRLSAVGGRPREQLEAGEGSGPAEEQKQGKVQHAYIISVKKVFVIVQAQARMVLVWPAVASCCETGQAIVQDEVATEVVKECWPRCCPQERPAVVTAQWHLHVAGGEVCGTQGVKPLENKQQHSMVHGGRGTIQGFEDEQDDCESQMGARAEQEARGSEARVSGTRGRDQRGAARCPGACAARCRERPRREGQGSTGSEDSSRWEAWCWLALFGAVLAGVRERTAQWQDSGLHYLRQRLQVRRWVCRGVGWHEGGLRGSAGAAARPGQNSAAAAFRLVISNAGSESELTVDLKNGTGSVTVGGDARAGCTVTLAGADMVALTEGKVDVQRAYASSGLQIHGCVKLAKKLMGIIRRHAL